MKISILSHDLSHNCLGRAHVLARLVQGWAEVEIVGPLLGSTIWEPLRHDRSVRLTPVDRAAPAAIWAGALDGDIIYSVKAQQTSLGLADLIGRRTGQPVIADVDDWELGFFLDRKRWLLRNLVPNQPNNVWAGLRAEKLVGRAAAVTVSSSWLQRRFGGQIIPHARSAADYDPAHHDPADHAATTALRAGLAPPDRRIVMFLGSSRRHKGTGDVHRAIEMLGANNIQFVTVGGGDTLPARPWLTQLGPVPFDQVARLLSVADVVVLAQQPSRVAAAQVPAKVFDAMAMGKPVLATRVSDLPQILDGGGVIVEPGDITGLASALGALMGDPERRRQLGDAGRRRFLAEYSIEAVAPRLRAVLEGSLSAV